MSATRYNDAVLSLIAAYAASGALEGVPVYDGPVAMTGSDNDYIIVGHNGTLGPDGSLAADVIAGTTTEGNLVMPGVREEKGYISCLIVSQTGDSADTAARRQRASDLLDAAEDAVLAGGGYPTGVGAGLMFDGTSDSRWITKQAGTGVAVLLAYRVSYSSGY